MGVLVNFWKSRRDLICFQTLIMVLSNVLSFSCSASRSLLVCLEIHIHSTRSIRIVSLSGTDWKLGIQTPKWQGFQADWWLQWFKSKEHKTQNWRLQHLISSYIPVSFIWNTLTSIRSVLQRSRSFRKCLLQLYIFKNILK